MPSYSSEASAFYVASDWIITFATSCAKLFKDCCFPDTMLRYLLSTTCKLLYWESFIDIKES